MMNWLRSHLPTCRRLIQLYAALLSNANLTGFLEGKIYTGPLKAACVPGLNCYSCPGAVGACPLGALQNALAASGTKAPVYVLGILMLLGLTLGRTICGFLCPMGLMQELLHKIPGKKLRKGRWSRWLSWMKYAVLAVFVVILPLWHMVKQIPLPAFCKYICPAGTLEGAIGLLIHPANAELSGMLGSLFAWKALVLALTVVACILIYRAFCRFLCPLGAIYGLFAKVALLGVQVEPSACTGCDKCVRRCPVDIRRVGDRECIQCGACVAECPTGAISWKGKKVFLRGKPVTPQKKRGLRLAAWGAALILLGGVMAAADWYQAPETPTPMAENVGAEVGMHAADFTLPRYGGGEISLTALRGKVVVLNFWATWCTPCVKELPYFQEIHDDYPVDVAVVAIHSHLVTEDVDAYLAGFDYTMPFALDETGTVIASLGGSTLLPQTVILDRNGVIVYNRPGSLTAEELHALIAPLQ